MFIYTLLLDFSKGFLSIISWYLWKIWCLYIASTIGDTARPCCNEGNGAKTGAGTSARMGAGIKGDTDRLEGAESKVIDIIISDKTNKTLIQVNY